MTSQLFSIVNATHSPRFVSWGFLLILAINMPPQFTDEKSNDSSMREWMPLDALSWFGRGNELHTPKSFQFVREGSKSWALSMVPHFSLSPPRFAFLAWGDYTCSRFARSTIPEEIWGPLAVYVSCPSQKQIDERVLIPFVRCQAGPECLSTSLIFDLSVFFIFSFF